MIELLKDTLREQESMLEEQSEILTSKEEELMGWETGRVSDFKNFFCKGLKVKS